MEVEKPTLEAYKLYVLKKSLYTTFQIILWYIIVIFLLSYIPPVALKLITDYEYPKDILSPIKQTSEYLSSYIPLKDSVLTALGALVLTLFIYVRGENKETHKVSTYDIATAIAYKTFSDFIIVYTLGPIMFINFCSGALNTSTTDTDKPVPWIMLFFMFFILMIRSIEKDTVSSIKKQILQIQWRISTLKMYTDTQASPKDDIIYKYEYLKPFRDLYIKSFGYIRIKYHIINKYTPLMLVRFLFMSYMFYFILSIESFLLLLANLPYGLENLMQEFHYIGKNITIAIVLSLTISIVFIFLDIIRSLLYNTTDIYSRKGFEGYILRIIFFITTEGGKLTYSLVFLEYMTNKGIYKSLEEFLTPYILVLLSMLTISYIYCIYKIRKYLQIKINQDLDLPRNQEGNEAKISVELYYLNTKLESLDEILKTLLEETQDSYTQRKNSSNINSDNINSSCE